MTKVAGWVERLRMVSPIQSLRAALLFLAAMLLFLPLQLFQVGIQLVQALFPETAVVLHPVGDLSESARLEPAGPPLRVTAASDQACALEHLQVLGHRGKADIEGLGQVGHRCLARGEARQDRAARGIGQGSKGAAEAVGLHLTDRLNTDGPLVKESAI